MMRTNYQSLCVIYTYIHIAQSIRTDLQEVFMESIGKPEFFMSSD